MIKKYLVSVYSSLSERPSQVVRHTDRTQKRAQLLAPAAVLCSVRSSDIRVMKQVRALYSGQLPERRLEDSEV